MKNPQHLAPYIRSFFEDHLVSRKNVSHNTIQSYRDSLKLFLCFAARQLGKSVVRLSVQDVQESLITDFLTHLEQQRGNTIQTRNHRLVAIRCLIEYISNREPQLLDHCRRILTIPTKRGAQLPQIEYLEKEEVTAILGAVARNHALGQRDYTLLLLMYNTGARVQELADARVAWLSLAKPYKIEILGKGQKWRTCPLWENTVCNLRQLLDAKDVRDGQDSHLFTNRFGRPISRSGIAKIIRRHVTKAAVEMPSLCSKHVTPHTFRHTTAMHLLQSGVEVNVIRSWLGHVSIATTNRYIEIDLAMKAKALEACEIESDGASPAPWRTDPDLLNWLQSL
jgi:site-specific recombinase XerD